MAAKVAGSNSPALVEPEVIAELAPLQEEIFFRSTQVEELPNETLVDLSVEPTLELIPSLTAMRASFFF